MTVLFFDLNGTLVDDVDLAHACCVKAFEKAGFPLLSKEEFTGKYDMPIGIFYQNCGLKNSQIWQHGPAMRETFFRSFAEGSPHQPLREGAKELLAACHSQGHKIVVFTNSLTETTESQLAGHGLAPFISAVLGRSEKEIRADESKGRKFLRLLQTQNIKTGAAMMIGDTPEEILLAKALRMTSVAVEGGWATPARLAAMRPDYQISSLTELGQIVLRGLSAA